MTRINIIIILILFGFIKAASQTPNWVWAKGGLGNAEGFNVATDNSNNVYYVGGFTDTLTFGANILVDTNGVNPIPYIVKYNSSGTVKWAKSTGGPSGGYSNSVATDKFGHVYVTGHFSSSTISFGSFVLTSNGGYDVFLVKYDTLGNVIWAKNAGGTQNDYGLGVATDATGNVFITGHYGSPTMSVGTSSLNNSGSLDIFIAKYSSSGNVLWAKSASGSSTDQSFCIATDAAGNSYITGNFGSTTLAFAPYTITVTISQDFFLTKYDPSGNVLWVKNAGGTNAVVSKYIATNSFNKIFITGYFNSPSLTIGSHTLYSTPTGEDAFIIEYDSNGNVKWAKGSAGSGDAQAYCVATDAYGNVYTTGPVVNSPVTFDTFTVQPINTAYDPLFIVKYDSTGNVTYATSLISGGDDEFGIIVDANNDLYVCSDFTPPTFTIGADNLILKGSESPYVAKLHFPTDVSVSEINNDNSNVVLFPNPFSNKLTIKSNYAEITEITIYDVASRTILQQTFSNIILLDTEQLSQGLYFYSVKTKFGQVDNGKIIKQ